MAVLYKLTDENEQTFGGTQWGEGVEEIADGIGDLCTAGWIHAYTDPLLAVMLNPIHAGFAEPHVWVADGDVGKSEHGLKVGCTRLRTLRRIALPTVTTEQRVRFGILCAAQVYHEPRWQKWADGWLSGKDRSLYAARAAARAATWAAAAEEEAAEEAAEAARAAAWANSTWDIIALAKRAVNGE